MPLRCCRATLLSLVHFSATAETLGYSRSHSGRSAPFTGIEDFLNPLQEDSHLSRSRKGPANATPPPQSQNQPGQRTGFFRGLVDKAVADFFDNVGESLAEPAPKYLNETEHVLSVSTMEAGNSTDALSAQSEERQNTIVRFLAAVGGRRRKTTSEGQASLDRNKRRNSVGKVSLAVEPSDLIVTTRTGPRNELQLKPLSATVQDASNATGAAMRKGYRTEADPEHLSTDANNQTEDMEVLKLLPERSQNLLRNEVSLIDGALQPKEAEWGSTSIGEVHLGRTLPILLGLASATIMLVLFRLLYVRGYKAGAEAPPGRIRAALSQAKTFVKASGSKKDLSHVPKAISSFSPIHTEVKFEVAMDRLLDLALGVKTGALDILGISGRHLLIAHVRDLSDGRRRMSLSSPGRDTCPHVTVVASWRRAMPQTRSSSSLAKPREHLEIFGQNDEFYGTLTHSSSGSGSTLVQDGKTALVLDVGNWTELRMIASAANGNLLASAGFFQGSDVGGRSGNGNAWRLQVEWGVDSVLVVACMLSMVLLLPPDHI